MKITKKAFISNKSALYFVVIVLILLIGGFFGYKFSSSKKNKNITTAFSSADAASNEEIYKMFLCPCCGDTIDKRCCDMAIERINFIDVQIAAGLSKNEVIIKTAEKYGITSLVESKRSEIEEAMAKRNPNLFPAEKLSFENSVGKKAPDFNLESINGKTIKLSDYSGKNIVLFFNEGAMCYPACWDQIADLGNDERFNTQNTVVFSIVVDEKAEWEQIVKKVPKLSKAKILFDNARAVSSAYDVLSLKSSMHPGHYPGHTYFIIDKEGIIQYTLDDPNMAIWNDKLAEEVNKLV